MTGAFRPPVDAAYLVVSAPALKALNPHRDGALKWQEATDLPRAASDHRRSIEIVETSYSVGLSDRHSKRRSLSLQIEPVRRGVVALHRHGERVGSPHGRPARLAVPRVYVGRSERSVAVALS